MANLQDDFSRLNEFMNTEIIGQPALVERMLIALLADGHMLVEGAPGLAKTRAVKTLASAIECDAHRIQFTPDLLPSDITGSDVFHADNGRFSFQKGPIFHNLVLADEINRSPAKVQSALLEAMGERQVTVGDTTYLLPDLFMVMATQNPIEHEGTYPLPEAQLDRFLMYVTIEYPSLEAEREILRVVRDERFALEKKKFQKITQKAVMAARKDVGEVYLSRELEEYLVEFVVATRNPAPYDKILANYVEYGASPRGTIALDVCSKACAWLRGSEFVTPEHIHAVIHDVLRHRIILTYEAEARGITPDTFIDMLLKKIPTP